MIRELHVIITSDTLAPKDAGRIRKDADSIKVIDNSDGTVLHTPPPAAQLPERLQALCDFANLGGTGFIHPVVRAILVHFWLGHDHPFCDGNGRTARALFYWSMLNQEYWLTEYVSISRILNKAQSLYAYSYLYSETRPYDATCFVRYQLEVIQRSIEDLHKYLERKVGEVHQVETLLRSHRNLNHRQLDLLSEALRDALSMFTISSHATKNHVANETARQDLYRLRDMGLLLATKRGKRLEFKTVSDLQSALQNLEDE